MKSLLINKQHWEIMVLTVKQKLEEAKTLISSKRFPEAVELLRSLDSPEPETVEYGHYCLLYAEASLYVGDCHTELIDDAIEIFRFGPRTNEFAKAKLLKGWLLSTQSKYIDAKEELLEAYANYRRCNNLSGSSRALSLLSYASHQLGDIHSAMANLDKCATIYRQLSLIHI